MNLSSSLLLRVAGGIVVAGLLVISASTSIASPILDQSTLGTSYRGGMAITNGRELAELVTTGVGGELSRVDLQILRDAGAPGDVEVRIRRTTNGFPTPQTTAADILRVIPQSQLPLDSGSNGAVPITSLDVSDAGFSVSPGEEIAVTVMLTASGGGAPPWTLFSDGTNIPGAELCYWNNNVWGTWSGAAGIQTWVDVPEPAVLSLLVLGALGILRPRKP